MHLSIIKRIPIGKIFLSIVILIIINQNLAAQSESVQLYDKNLTLIDLGNEQEIAKIDFILIDTARFKFAPIHHIPEDILLFKNLKTVSFSVNDDSDLDRIFNLLAKIPTLENLEIDGNNFNVNGIFEPEKYECLTSFPIQVNSLTNLRQLSLTGHLFDTVIIDPNKLKNLESIILFRNKIKHFPTAVLRLPELSEIALGGNYISEIPTDLCDSKIKELILDRNSIIKVPDCLISLETLRYLALGENFISKVDSLHYMNISKERQKRLNLNLDKQYDMSIYPKYDPTKDVIKKLSGGGN